MTDDSLKCFGIGTDGRKGYGASSSSKTATTVINLTDNTNLTDVLHVSTGTKHACAVLTDACAVLTDNSISCWGDNTDGQVGNNQADGVGDVLKATPVTDSDGLTLNHYAHVAAGFNHTCAVTISGTLQCWGGNESDQIGNNIIVGADSLTPSDVIDSESAVVSGFVQVTSGYYMSCALKNDQSVWCWGENYSGSLGDGSTTDSGVPVQVINADDSPLSGAVAVGTSLEASYYYAHTCALLETGEIKCWGSNYNGQLGTENYANSYKAVAVLNGSASAVTSATLMSVGQQRTCAKISGTLKCWGNNISLALGDGTGDAAVDQLLATSVPISAKDAGGSNFSGMLDVSQGGGSNFTCAINASNKIECWGYGSSGELGDGQDRSNGKPVTVIIETDDSDLSGVTQISSGEDFSCALPTYRSHPCGRRI